MGHRCPARRRRRRLRRCGNLPPRPGRTRDELRGRHVTTTTAQPESGTATPRRMAVAARASVGAGALHASPGALSGGHCGSCVVRWFAVPRRHCNRCSQQCSGDRHGRRPVAADSPSIRPSPEDLILEPRSTPCELPPSPLGAGQPRGRAVDRLSEDPPLLGFCRRTLSWRHQGCGSSGSTGASGSAEKTPAFACQLRNTLRKIGWGSCGRGPLKEDTVLSFAFSVTVNVTVNVILAQGSGFRQRPPPDGSRSAGGVLALPCSRGSAGLVMARQAGEPD